MIIFLFDIILEQRRFISIIDFEIRDFDNILNSFIVLDEHEFTRFLTLIEQKIVNHVTYKSDVKIKINFHEIKKI